MTTNDFAPKPRSQGAQTADSILDPPDASRGRARPKREQLDELLASVHSRYGLHGQDPAEIEPRQAEQADKILGGILGGPDRGGLQHFGGSSKASVAATTAAHAAGPPKVDFGDVEVEAGGVVGYRQFYQDFIVYNSGGIDAYPTISYAGDPEIQLARTPNRLRPTTESHDPLEDIRLVYSPKARGSHHGVITVSLTWQGERHRPEHLHIPVTAAAHMPGEPTNAEATAAANKAAKDAADAEAKAKTDEEHKAEIDMYLEEKPGALVLLEDATNAAGDQVDTLAREQAIGVGTAQGEVLKFKRKKPVADESLVHALAMLALDMVTGGIAGAISKTLEDALHVLEAALVLEKGKAFEVGGSTIKFFADAVKEGIKGGAKRARSGGGGSSSDSSVPPATDDGSSTDPQLRFFQDQLSEISQTTPTRKDDVRRSRRELMPLANRDLHAAVKAMKAVEDSIKAHVPSMANQQAGESVRQWLRVLTQSALGSTGDDAHRDTNMKPASLAPTETSAPSMVDGLIDIGFECEDPTAPAVVKKAAIRGVSNDVASRLRARKLLDLRLPARAFGLPSGHLALLPVTVARSEAGAISFTDDTGAPGQPSRWLSRKAGHTGHAQSEGAKKLIEEEIMSKSLDEHGVSMETDHDASAER